MVAITEILKKDFPCNLWTTTTYLWTDKAKMGERVYTVYTTEMDRWQEVLHRCGTYDVYHLPSYHRLAEEQDNVQARLFVFESDIAIIAMPFLQRKIEAISATGSTDCCDVTSVYGYAGPVCNVPQPSDAVLWRFARSLRDYFKQQRVVTAFSRLNPLLDQSILLHGCEGEIVEVGTTVAIDLSLPVDVQRQKYRADHKRGINKLNREGIICVHDEEWKYLDAFFDIYCDTMRRTGAKNEYYYDRAYFERLRMLLGDRLHLFVTLKEGEVLSGGLLTICNAIIQYHLAGTDSRHLDVASSKLIIDTVRLWGNRIGARLFHLGGGVGAREDNLFHFKAGFSDTRYQFKAWRTVVDPLMYENLVRQKQAWNEVHGLQVIDDNYFPVYRSPTRSISGVDLCMSR